MGSSSPHDPLRANAAIDKPRTVCLTIDPLYRMTLKNGRTRSLQQEVVELEAPYEEAASLDRVGGSSKMHVAAIPVPK